VASRFPYSPSCFMFELICLQERPGFMVPCLILYMGGIEVTALVVVVYSIILFTSNFLTGFLTLVIGELIVGKQCTCISRHACVHTHTHIHSFIHSFIHSKQEYILYCIGSGSLCGGK
jgi:hypothetical protein